LDRVVATKVGDRASDDLGGMAANRRLADGKLDGGGGNAAADVAEVGRVGAWTGLFATTVGTGALVETGGGKLALDEATERVARAAVVVGDARRDGQAGAGHRGRPFGDGYATLDEGGERLLGGGAKVELGRCVVGDDVWRPAAVGDDAVDTDVGRDVLAQ